jgi:hypothetical protein
MWMVCGGLLAGLGAGCSRHPGLELTMIDSSVRKPSNVAVYFSVETREGDPVPGLTAEAFRIYEDDRLISVHESQQTILNPELAAAHYTLLLVDMSGSVTESGDVPTIVSGATTFASRIGKQQEVAVYAFDGSERLTRISGFSRSSDAVGRSIERLDGYKPKDPSTNLNGAVIEGLDILDKQLRRGSVPLRFGTLVVFTDGTDRAARVDRDRLYDTVEASSHEIFVIGVGDEIDEGELRSIGKDGTILSKDRREISAAFEQAAARIEAETRKYYLLGYCSPARAGVHEVRIEAIYQGKSGSLSQEFNANGFRAPCDPNQPPAFKMRGQVAAGAQR